MTNNYEWSNAYWNFFHILSCNINDSKLSLHNLKLIRIFINNLILSIPCEKCKVDTHEYFKNNLFQNITKKKDFINFFFNFHNYVNLKTNKIRFRFSILKKYDNLNIKTELNIIDRIIFKNSLDANVYKFFILMTK